MARSTVVADVVCPFCGLGCDDAVVEVEGAAVTARDGTCPRAARLFRRTGEEPAEPRIAGQPASREAAVARAAELVRGARAIVIGGLGTDVAGAQASIELAGRFGAVLDHHASEGLFRNLATQRRIGWMAATLAEVRNRCDLLVVIGADPTPQFERLFERVAPRTGAFLGALRRRVVFLGGAPGEAALKQLPEAEVSTIELAPEALADAVAALRLAAAGKPVLANVPPAVSELAADLKAARYGVLAWASGLLPSADADLIVERIVGVVDALNVTTRAACLPLGGQDGIIAVNQTMLWRLGFPMRTAIRGQLATHDPELFALDRALADADLLVWIAALSPVPPPAFDGPVIALTLPGTAFERAPEVVIPVGTPGIDHAGHIFRMDAIVSLPLVALRSAGLPSVAEVLGAIEAQAGREGP